MSADILYQVALTLVPSIGPIYARSLVEHFGNARDIFFAKSSQLQRIPGMGETKARSIKAFRGYERAEEEIRFIEKNNITPLFLTDAAYPRRLLNCYDSPTLLYHRGTTDFNATRIVSIIGTRSHTEYGKQITENLIAGLANHQVLVISGLAYGIDAIAHRTALKNNLPTVAVMAHGLDLIYPSQHAGLAREMIDNKGGLLTEFASRTNPDRHNFPSRNRIVAGISDATIVMETGIKGGSMITADLANGYNRDVFAFPGRANDPKSAGCNYLIRNNKSMLLTDPSQLVEIMNWENKKPPVRKQKQLFVELTAEEKTIVSILSRQPACAIDEINLRSGLSSSAVAAAILSLELQHLVISLPGKLYRLS